VYRVVQEALTNTLKHAGRTRTVLRVAWEPERARLTVRLCDDGPRPDGERAADDASDAPVRPPVVHGAGHGLVGMRERVGAVGGSLHTGIRPGGGYCVHAVIPLPTTAPASSLAPRHEGHFPYAEHPRPAGR
jgi:signal transduction histidine kinase